MRGVTRPMFAAGLLLAATLATTVTGCGSDTSYSNQLRPPETLIVSASISNRSVSVSPRAFGAGPITIVITNQSRAPQQLTVETAGSGAGITQKTGPINPGDTATMKLTPIRGVYRVAASGRAIRPGRLLVGTPRPSAQNDLLQP